MASVLVSSGDETIISLLERDYPAILTLLSDYSSCLREDTTNPLTLQSFWDLVEVEFALLALVCTARRQLSKWIVSKDGMSVAAAKSRNSEICKSKNSEKKDEKDIEKDPEAAIVILERAAAIVAQMRKTRMERTPDEVIFPLRLAKEFQMSDVERKIFFCMICEEASTSTAFKLILAAVPQAETRFEKPYQRFLSLSGATELDATDFLSDKRLHIEDGAVLWNAADYEPPRVRPEVARACRGLPLTRESILKLTDTRVHRLLEDTNFVKASSETEKRKIGDVKGTEKNSSEEENEPSEKRRKLTNQRNNHDCGCETKVGEVFDNDKEEKGSIEGGLSSRPRASSFSSIASKQFVEEFDGKHLEEDKPYTSNLEYLEDRFKLLQHTLQVAKLRREEGLKRAGAEKRPEYSFAQTKAANRFEESAKMKLAKARIARRLALTEESIAASKNRKSNDTSLGSLGKMDGLPRLEQLSKKLNLCEFEKNVVVLIIGHTISPIIRALFVKGNEGQEFYEEPLLTVKRVLQTFCSSFSQQVRARVHFYKSAATIRSGLIQLQRERNEDLVEAVLCLDRRLLDWIVGLDTEISEAVEGSNLYSPSATLGQVVLPSDLKESLLSTVRNYDKFRAFRKQAQLDDSIHNIGGLVIMLHGPSGTGKTLTVNALAAELGKRVLLVNFDILIGTRPSSLGAGQPNLKGLFREAEMSDAILFFDECEAFFSQRDRGGSVSMSNLLTELERHQGIVFLATNRPFDLDEAMHRRITAVFEFRQPDFNQRRDIWRMHTQTRSGKKRFKQKSLTSADAEALLCEKHNKESSKMEEVVATKLPICPEIDWDEISLKFELTGGFIKNAVLSALLLAISRNDVKPLITQSDIVKGCKLQMRGALKMRAFSQRVVPISGLENLILLSDSHRKQLQSLINFEKARAILFGSWGFTGTHHQPGSTALFWGPSGAGKTATASAVGFEVGRPLKVVSCAELFLAANGANNTGRSNDAGADGRPRSGAGAIFDDARLMEAVLVIENCNVDSFAPSENMELQSSVQLLLHEIERFKGLIIMIWTTPCDAMSSHCISAIPPELRRRLQWTIEFKLPRKDERALLWKSMIPKGVPIKENCVLDWDELATFELSGSQISNAIMRAAAKAALRTKSRFLRQKDLINAAREEKKKSSTTTMMRIFT
eukprot:g2859.t1